MLGPPENVGTQRWSLLFDRLVFWFVCLILPGWSHSLTHKGPSEKSRATKHSIWLHHSLQWPWARSQFTRSFKGPNVRVVNRFKLEKCACVCVHQGVFSFCNSWGHRSVWVTTWIIVSSRVPGEDAEPLPCPSWPVHLPCKSCHTPHYSSFFLPLWNCPDSGHHNLSPASCPNPNPWRLSPCQLKRALAS